MTKKQGTKRIFSMTKEQRKKWIRNVIILAIICAIPYIVIPELRAWVIENPLTILLGLVQAAVLFSVLMLGAYLLLKWVRAEKKEEDEL